MIRSDFILRGSLTLLFTYLAAVGATFNGVITPEFKTPTLWLMGIIMVAWLLIRWRRGWCWHATPLDGVLLLWMLAFVLSLLANLDSWRRIVIGLWYMGIYIVTWYALQDAIANRALKREILVDSLLITGLVVMIFAFMQVQSWLRDQLPLITAGIEPFDLPRPVGTIGNPNAFGTFMLVLAPLALGRIPALGRDRIGKALLSLYTLLAMLLVFLTYSRGAWLGLLAAVGVLIAMLLWHYDLLSFARLRAWWTSLKRRRKTLLVGIGVVTVIAMGIAAVLFILSFNMSGRGLDRRTVLYQPAIDLFTEQPLTGHGLFTFGQGYTRLVSFPPNQPHSHAHDAILHIGAELGLIGLAALFATLAVMIRAIRRNWQIANQRQQLTLAASTAAVTGFAVHHLLDTPAMMPAIALTGLLIASIALTPFEPEPVTNRGRKFAYWGVFPAAIILLGIGFWSSDQYSRYVDILKYGLNEGDYRGAAEQLETIINADPSLALYHLQQAYFLGLAADEGDTQAAQDAIVAYARFLAIEPQNAIAWADKAALHWQLGQTDSAIESMQQAVNRAPSSWQLAFNLGRYAEETGDLELASNAYERALNAYSRTHPAWDETDLRRELAAGQAPSALGQVVLTLETGDTDAALSQWESLLPEKTPAYNVIRALIALAQADQSAAFTWLARANDVVDPNLPEHEAWIHLGTARVAQYDGQTETAESEMAAARALLEPSLFDEDVVFATNIPHFQFLRLGIARQFLPQLDYPTADPLLLRLLETS